MMNLVVKPDFWVGTGEVPEGKLFGANWLLSYSYAYG